MITVNGESRTLEKPVTVTEYLEACNYVPVQVVVEILQFMGGGSC